MLERGFTEVLESSSRDDLRNQIVAFTYRLGFETVSATVVIDHLLGEPEFLTVDNTPQIYKDSFQDRDTWRRDPVMQHCKHESRPIIWDQATYVSHGAGDLWEEQAQYGYQHGIALAMHMPEGRHFFIGVDGQRPTSREPEVLTRMVADLQLFAVHAHEAAVRILIPSTSARGAPALTPRELETLRWTMEGKTAWEVGTLLGISERTAALHVNNATHKLGCVNKHQAVLQALRLGLIR